MRFSALALNKRLSLPARIFLLLIALTAMLQPAMAGTVATVTYSTGSQNFGTVNIGNSQTAIFSFNVSGTIGSVEVVTQGSPNLDFTDAGGGSCTSGTSSACTVDVKFAPIYAGLRRGAVLFWSGANNTGTVIGKTLIYGVGYGGQIVYGPSTWTTLANPTNLSPGSFNGPTATAVDGNGNLYVVDGSNNRLVEYPAQGSPISIDPIVSNPTGVKSSFSFPNKAVVDGAGDVWIADADEARIVELPVGNGTPIGIQGSVNGKLFNSVEGLDVDGVGNVYVADTESYRVLELTSISSDGTATGQVVPLPGFSLLFVTDVWLDAWGNLFISDVGFDYNTEGNGTYYPTNPQVLKVNLSNGSVTSVTAPGTGCAVEGPDSVEGDAAGNLFIGDDIPDANLDTYFTGRILEYPAGGGPCIITGGTLLGKTIGGAVDGLGIGEVNLSPGGDIYAGDIGNNRVLKMQRSVVPSVNFSHSTAAGTADTTDGTQSVPITNIGNTTLNFDELTYPTDFAAGTASNQCTSSSVIAINGTCNVAIEFYPQNSGSLSENITLGNNANGGTQTIAATGTGTGTAPSITSADGTTFVAGSANSFEVSASGTPSPTFSESGALPCGVTFSSAGVLTGIPCSGTGGSYSITITASNGISPAASQTFTLAVDEAPAITSGNSTSVTVGTAISFSASATGYPAPTFSEAGSLPSGVTFSPSGVLSGTPFGASGSYPIVITASNGISPDASQNFTVVVNPGAATHFSVSAPSPVYTGSAFTFTVNAQDGWNNLASSYNGEVTFTSSDTATGVSLPGNTSLSNGTGSFTATLVTLGGQAIGVSDVATGSITGTSNGIRVNPLPNLVVTTAADDAPSGSAPNCDPTTMPNASCSLRDALLESANLGAGAITFDPTVFASAQAIYPTGVLPVIPADTTITGPTSGTGASLTNLLTVNGGLLGNSPIFTVNAGATITMANLIVANGSSESGGAGLTNAGTATISNCTFTNDLALSPGSGGAISNTGLMTVSASTFAGNFAFSKGGAIENQGNLTIIDSTFNGNTVGPAGFGGAIDNHNAPLVIEDSTIYGNSTAGSGSGGGINNSGGLFLYNSIVAGNVALGNSDISGVVDGAYDLIGSSAGESGLDNGFNGNQVGTSSSPLNPNLSPLGSYGGPTQTMLPLPSSAAICGGATMVIPSGLSTDQRGFTDINNVYTLGTPCVDAGAVQTNYALSISQQPSNSTVSEPITPAPAVSVTESGNPVSGATVTVADADNALSGTATQTTAAGTATFSGLSITSPETGDTLTFTLPLSGSLNMQATSNPFDAGYTAPVLTSPAPGATLKASSETFRWTSAAPRTSYLLKVSTLHFGGSDVFDGNTSATSLLVPSIPTNGAPLYVQLSYKLNGAWVAINYTYTEKGAPTPPVMMTPAPSSTLGGSSATFTWSAGAGPTAYALKVGTTHAGASDVYASSTTGTSLSVPSGIPTNGGTLYVTLEYEIGTTWTSINYTYMESGGGANPPTMVSPAPGSTLTGANVTFNWNAGTGDTEYRLRIGSTGPGSSDLYLGNPTVSLSETVSGLPTNGLPVYVTVGYKLNGVWHAVGFTYTAQ